MSPDDLPLVLRKRIVVTLTGHWLWTGFDENGYGKHTFKRRTWRVHRLVYTLLVGPIPDDLDLDHDCRVVICCNPAHCTPRPHAENVLLQRAAMVIASNNRRRMEKTHCVNDHEYTSETVYFWKGRRQCMVCNREKQRRYRARKREAG